MLSVPEPLCVTIGEPSGIGPDILLLAWCDRQRLELPQFFVVADPGVLERRAQELRLTVPMTAVNPETLSGPSADSLPILELHSPMRGETGRPSAADAPLVVEAIRNGVATVFSGKASAIVTCPISKETLYAAGFKYPGHTEFLADLAREHTGIACHPVMMIASDALRTVPVTIHVPLRDVPSLLTRDLIVATARVTAHDLTKRFGIANPRLAVSGLNPHAGEGGTMGREEIDIIIPAIRQLQSEGINAFGPLSADTMFHSKAREAFDVAICMYHDQALIPAKTLAFDNGVNVTLGLPFIRTSPDHGTAFGIAGKGSADPTSFVSALKLAHRLAKQALAQ